MQDEDEEEDNDGRFPDESPVEVRYPRSLRGGSFLLPIYGLGRMPGQDGTVARLLPLSVDGLILAASLALLHEARSDWMRHCWPGLASSGDPTWIEPPGDAPAGKRPHQVHLHVMAIEPKPS